MDTIDDREAFENAYFYYVLALKTLAATPEEACEINGYFNTAFEIKHDVGAGPYLFNNAECPLSPGHKKAITDLLVALESVPQDLLSFTSIRQESLARMRHASWRPTREMAARLLKDLQPFTERNSQYFANGSREP